MNHIIHLLVLIIITFGNARFSGDTINYKLWGENVPNSYTTFKTYSFFNGYYYPIIPNNTSWTFQLSVIGNTNNSVHHSEYIIGSCYCDCNGDITFDNPKTLYVHASGTPGCQLSNVGFQTWTSSLTKNKFIVIGSSGIDCTGPVPRCIYMNWYADLIISQISN